MAGTCTMYTLAPSPGPLKEEGRQGMVVIVRMHVCQTFRKILYVNK